MMKRESWFTLLSGFIFALLVSFSCTACLASAFDLHIKSAVNPLPINFKSLLVLCAFFSLLMSFFHTRKLDLCAFITLVLLFLYLWFFEDLELSLEALCNAISKRYNNVYGWRELRWSNAPLSRIDKTLALQFLAALLCAAVTWTVCRRQELVWALAAAILPIVPCTFITSTVPNAKFLGLWLVALVLLILTQASRKRSAQQGNRMLLILTFPVTLAVILLFRFAPQDGYNGEKTADALLRKMQAMFSVSISDIKGGASRNKIELSATGNMRQRRVPVMTVTAPSSGVYYLRGRAYDTYTGTQWTDSGKDYELPWCLSPRAELVGSFSVEARYLEDVLYYPYTNTFIPRQPLSAPEPDYLKNIEDLTEYSFEVYSHRQSPSYLIADEQSREAFLYLPEHTQKWAQTLVLDIIVSSGNIDYIPQDTLVECIQSYVRQSATYSLKTPRMDGDYDDFAQWFLEDSDTGYCVHFATAATVLLRAAGIPARYVTGYAVDTIAEEAVTVYELDAHAWVEYWDAYTGWQILDATPAAEESTNPTTPPVSSTSPTQPSTAPPDTSKPSETQKPSTSTRPSETTPSVVPKAESISHSAIGQALKYGFLVILLIALVLAQWRLRVIMHQRALRHGTAKQRVLCAWQQSLHYAHALGQAPDKKLRSLAEKAKFSPYTPTAEELRAFDTYFRGSIAVLKAGSVWRRMYVRLILALY